MIYNTYSCALTTKHNKLNAISRPFSKILGVKVIEFNEDTDKLGTFSGEIERSGTSLDVLKKKCEWGMNSSGFVLGLASEGSFGPHPSFFFAPCDYEELIFMDKEKDFYLRESILSMETNYQFKEISHEDEFPEFAAAIKFPSHGVIVRPSDWKDKSVIFKGIQSFKEFKNAFYICKDSSSCKVVRVESDMRAHMNPSRMKVIGQVAGKLAQRLSVPCPKCRFPGWGTVRFLKGLECSECQFPTQKIKEEVLGCVKCDFEAAFRKATYAGPESCLNCNP